MGTEATSLLARLTQSIVAAKASDAHIRSGQPLFVRHEGRLAKGPGPPLTAAQVASILTEASGRDVERMVAHHWEFSCGAGQFRFRGHAFRETNGWGFTLRAIPPEIPAFQELRLPPGIRTLAEPGPGLTLVTGPMGSGKSTTAAALMKHAVSGDPIHLLTLEDPIEFPILGGNGCVSQREVGRDVASYSDGLRAALREDPDYIFLGEIRDLEQLEVALQAAETGRTVLTTFHTSSAVKTVGRLIGMFRADEQVAARARLADSLRGIVCQRLLPRKGARARVLCTEVMINNYAAKECIRDAGRVAGLTAVMERSNDQNMHTLDQSMIAAVRAGVLELEIAVQYAVSPGDVRRALSLHGTG